MTSKKDTYYIGRAAESFDRVQWFQKYESLEKCFSFPTVESFLKYAKNHQIVDVEYVEVMNNGLSLKYCPSILEDLESYVSEAEIPKLKLYELDFDQLKRLEASNKEVESIDTLFIKYKDFELDLIDKYHVKSLNLKVTQNTDFAKLKDIEIPISLILGPSVKADGLPTNLESLEITTKKNSINFDFSNLEGLKTLKLTASKCQISLPSNLQRLEIKAFQILNEDISKVFPASLKYLSLSSVSVPEGFELPPALEEIECLGTDIRFKYPSSIKKAKFDLCYASMGSPGELPDSLEEIIFSDHGAPLPTVSSLSNLKKLRIEYLGMPSCETEGTEVILPENLETFESNDFNVKYIFNDKLVSISLGCMSRSKTVEKNNFPSDLKYLHVSDCSYMQLQNLPPKLQLLAIEDGTQSASFTVNLPTSLKMLLLTSSYIDDIVLSEGLKYMYIANGGKTDGVLLKKLPETLEILTLYNIFLDGDSIDLSESNITELHLNRMDKYRIELPKSIQLIQTPVDSQESLDNLDLTNISEITIVKGKSPSKAHR
ncbi:hypothetical protein CLIB1444_05S07228 [[Candida] jaroonii]|uniref:Uncharacterized protein n=1 Tax=[Candida] jaroonii TaxID=467808 RepID=A0ACA9Y997_9ASCO|nr:hypothetical protein CLIB1444_05S07228 [[Candida] jaroonii]